MFAGVSGGAIGQGKKTELADDLLMNLKTMLI